MRDILSLPRFSRLRTLVLALGALLASATLPALANPPDGAPSLGFPVDCHINLDCSVQKYFDHDPGPGAKDFMCGDLVNDKHTGIDIRIPSYVDMRRGVKVLAAAPGVVWRIRDGIEDINVRKVGAEVVDEYGLGNVVVIDHGNGWRSFYGHMLKGSLTVKEGDHVVAGQQVGLIGLSGLTEFPHVHFMIMHNKTPIDPFTGTAMTDPLTCGDTAHALWNPETLTAMAYTPTGPLIAGFSTEQPDSEAASNGTYDQAQYPKTASTLFFWANYFGMEAGDRQVLRIMGPDGKVIANFDQKAEKGRILMFRYVGVKAPTGGFPPGTYRAEFQLLRGDSGNDKIVAAMARTVEVQ
ncbi:M23 family metallopeptidase [Hypericibacter sp.]|uniref:M23 family metallopeptidase n=1 Tax=Hypericibacter sp. TaxID=2705401 RepID=UPI003D6D6957